MEPCIKSSVWSMYSVCGIAMSIRLARANRHSSKQISYTNTKTFAAQGWLRQRNVAGPRLSLIREMSLSMQQDKSALQAVAEAMSSLVRRKVIFHTIHGMGWPVYAMYWMHSFAPYECPEKYSNGTDPPGTLFQSRRSFSQGSQYAVTYGITSTAFWRHAHQDLDAETTSLPIV